MAAGFGAGCPVDGLEAGLASLGELLMQLAAGEDTAGDELPTPMTFEGDPEAPSL